MVRVCFHCSRAHRTVFTIFHSGSGARTVCIHDFTCDSGDYHSHFVYRARPITFLPLAPSRKEYIVRVLCVCVCASAYLYFLAPTHSTLVQSRFSLFHTLNSALYAYERTLFAPSPSSSGWYSVRDQIVLNTLRAPCARQIAAAADNFADFITPDLQVERG